MMIRLGRKKPRRPQAVLRGWRAFLRLLMLGGVFTVPLPPAKAELPVPCGGGTCAGRVWVASGQVQTPVVAGNAMTINQQSDKAILNWQSFNVGADNSVTFVQPSSKSVALNRIFQNDPSRILGRVGANGQIYLINRNGIIFGKGSQVDAHTLVASTLDISDEVFNNIGITNAINNADVGKRAAFEGTAGMGAITVEEGAHLGSAKGGRIMILAPRIDNRGEIRTPDGQAILAASQDKVYLANSDDESLRGLLVEVETGGDVTNLGTILAERGNVSMVGLAVNQEGVVRATTSVALNGSIHLMARDRVTFKSSGAEQRPEANRTGELTLGAGSLTEVTPDDLAETAVDAQAQAPSRVVLMGDQVRLAEGARIVAPGGEVSVTATRNPKSLGPSDANSENGSRVVMEAGSGIDVSGLDSAVLPMARNLVAVELRGNELRDSPLQRDGALRNEKVWVDVRKETPLADVSGQIAGIKRPLEERLSAGGRVSIVSEGEVAMREGAVIDVSGGAVRYEGGYLNTTKLISRGRLYDISDADPSLPYDGILSGGKYTLINRKWGTTKSYDIPGMARLDSFETGYVEGKDAGGVTINARSVDLQGLLQGEIIQGLHQRLPAGEAQPVVAWNRRYDQRPLGGELILGRSKTGDESIPDLGLGDIELRSWSDLGAAGMNRVKIYANGRITLPENADLQFAPGGELSLTAGTIEVQGRVAAPGGNIGLTAKRTTEVGDPSISLATGSGLDVSGMWVNDGKVLNPSSPPQGSAFIDGGTVTLNAAGDVSLASGSRIDAGGGAQLQRNGTLKAGLGGDIVISSTPTTQNSPPPVLRLDGELSAQALEKGGSLTLTGPGFRIGGPENFSAEAGVYLTPEFFAHGGFTSYDLTATQQNIILAADETLALSAENLLLNGDFLMQPSGGDIDRFSTAERLPDHQRPAVSLALTLARDSFVSGERSLALETGSRIQTEPGATVALNADTRIIVDGTIDAPAGKIELGLLKPDGNNLLIEPDLQQIIRLGPQGRLAASGAFQANPEGQDRGLRTGRVFGAGSVSMAAQRGYILADEGSLIDVSGVTRTLDINTRTGYETVAVNGAAGRIDLIAGEGMVLNGQLRGMPGSGAGAAGGTLNISLDPLTRSRAAAAREIVLSAETVAGLPAADQALPDELNGQVLLDPAKVRDGGFDSLSLRSRSADSFDSTAAGIRLAGDVQLGLKRSLVLDAPVLESDGGRAELGAAYVRLGMGISISTSADPAPGNGSLRLYGQHLDLVGKTALRGFGPAAVAEGGDASAPVRFESEGDIRLIGNMASPVPINGELYGAGRLDSSADISLRADQIYTSTVTDFTIAVAGEQGRIMVEPGGPSSITPLSARSRLSLEAASIEQYGTLRAPFGEILLTASKGVVLGDGSLTAVSGGGQTVPFGLTEFGQDWLYRFGNADNSLQQVVQAPPAKSVTLSAPSVTLESGSLVDVTGGGDLVAREFLPGPGGSKDILGVDNTVGAFAILPAGVGVFGSQDPYLSDENIKVGDTLIIAGGGPLAAGEYAVLPAGYALLPGAYLVTPVKAPENPLPGEAIRQFDGSSIVAAKRGAAGTDIRDSRWSPFRVENGAQFRTRAEYLKSSADRFFADQDLGLNRDAGRLVLDAGSALSLGGSLANSTSGGRGSEADIIAARLAVVTERSGSDERVEVLASNLNKLGAQSLLLGARRESAGEDVALDVRANEVRIEQGVEISAPEVMLAARESVTVAGGAGIRAGGADVTAPAAIRLNGDSAFARVSGGEQVRVLREGATGARGSVEIAAGARLDAARSITLDASSDTVVNGDIVTDEGSLSLAASRISVGETEGVSGGLVLSNEDLDRLNARDLRLTSRSTIDLYGAIELGLDHLELDAAGLAGFANDGRVAAIRADTLSLGNRAGRGFAATPDGKGTLNLAAREVSLLDGDFAVRGFDAVHIGAAQQIIAQPEVQSGVGLQVAGDLNLTASRITAARGADVSIGTRDASGTAVGKFVLDAPVDLAGLAPVSELGAELALTGTAIEHRGHIDLPSGAVSLHATGAGGVSVASGASIDVGGQDIPFAADLVVGSPGGTVEIVADEGDIAIAADAVIDVSGAAAGGDAGKLSLSAAAGGLRVDAGAVLAGAARPDARQGVFAADARTLANGFSALNAQLNAGGFTGKRWLRVREGDVSIATADRVRAREFTLGADAGKIDVFGAIDASGAQAGRVGLYANGDLTLHGSARIDTRATAADEKGGLVTLATVAGRIELQATDEAGAASIDVAGSDALGAREESGAVHLRAPRDGAAGVAIEPIAATIAGAGRIDVEATRVYTANRVDTTLIGSIDSDTTAFMAGAGQIKSDLGVAADARFHVIPGVEIQSPGDLALSSEWDLLNWRYGGEAGALTLRAAGDLNVNRSLSDGVAFVAPESPDLPGIFPERDIVQSGPSWSYRLAGGADLAAADPLATLLDAGDVNLASGVKLRTGTGTIELAAGDKLRFADSTAAIYTTGENRGIGTVPTGATGFSAETIAELLFKADFLKNGGDIRIATGGDILGADGHQFINEWLTRIGGDIALPTIDGGGDRVGFQSSWGINLAEFAQNIGALGGGDVIINAGGDLNKLSVVIPTTAQLAGELGTAPAIAGGGDLHIDAGGDIKSGVFYLGQGRGEIRSGGGLVRAEGSSAYPILALSDGQYDVRTRKDLVIEAVANPTMLVQRNTEGDYSHLFALTLDSYFFTYGDDSALRLESIAGDTLLRGDHVALGRVSDILQRSDPVALEWYPASLSARSLQGDVQLGADGSGSTRFTLLPTPRGHVELLAGDSIVKGGNEATLVLSDADSLLLPNSRAPALGVVDVKDKVLQPGAHAANPVHEGDTQAVRIIARDGDIGEQNDASLNQLTFVMAKQTRISAGRDVLNVILQAQNISRGDISSVEAGGNVRFTTQRNGSGRVSASDARRFEVAGPGEFYVIAGEDVDLGASQGIESAGNLKNPALADGGVSVTVMAGINQAPDYAGFTRRYLADTDVYRARLEQFLAERGVSSGGVEAFSGLPLIEQRKFLFEIFFDELRASGVGASEKGDGDYSRGFAAIKTLFPGEGYKGDIKSFLSKIYTLDGNGINLLVPGGLINAGVAGSSTVTKDAGKLGIVAQRDGDINVFVNGDFLVNQSRVFALDGGDILAWSSTGDIDAGRGAKTALFVPPSTTNYDADGNAIVEFPPAISGSGIRGAVSTPGRAPGNVYLFAPAGVVNAGDAGIGSAGNVTIGAVQVIGADNIDVGGVSIGVPVTDTGSLTAGTAALGDATGAVTKSVVDSATADTQEKVSSTPVSDAALAFLEVEVLGFGEESRTKTEQAGDEHEENKQDKKKNP